MFKVIRLTSGARLSLFTVSYLPLFFIMIFRQMYTYRGYLMWGGFDPTSIGRFIKYFGAVTLMGLVSVIGCIGLMIFIKNIKRRTKNSGDIVRIVDIENRNNESITYLFTYVIPFVFQDLSELTNIVSVSTLLLVTYCIYVNSSLVLINPTISLWYSLFMVEYVEHAKNDSQTEVKKKGMLLSDNKYLEENETLKIKKIGHRLFFGTIMED